jgi:hypothetical protein
MEQWVLISLIPPLLFAITNYIDSYILKKYSIDTKALPVYLIFTGGLTSLICYLFFGIELQLNEDIYSLIASGLSIMGGIYFYCRALQWNKIILIVILFQIIPVMGLIGGYFFFHEIPGDQQLFGSFLIITATLLVCFKKGEKFSFDQTFIYMILADILFCASNLIVKGMGAVYPVSEEFLFLSLFLARENLFYRRFKEPSLVGFPLSAMRLFLILEELWLFMQFQLGH